ncbi:uncharacterized protein SPAPADRAFT_65199 [Spathaspora passalidarum NRRL Y-27907]|uniref:Uncharacterized protein n=1 Tax=Spathaspora passalidarum (strain NRRL Y-27907 / 11-Y1) TaxID=619300 RepID=G3AJV7_SPAPN|nr:uncharacterized protein SPAPADRAFT_65199 [Spathaspora passalidarum NRRL Y-27907]EGW34007.1 hypothetical protein SPAPADRAFT_65199 [Spathaspora passalidarum NRRL Y-27907]
MSRKVSHEIIEYKSCLVSFVVFAIFLGVLFWFNYDRGIRRNGGFESLGEISLDEAGTDEIGSDIIVSCVVKSGTFSLARVKTFFDQVVFERITLGCIPGRRNYVKVPDGEEEATLFGNHNKEFQDDSSLNKHTFHDEAVGLKHTGQRDPDVLDERLFDIESDNDVPEVAREEHY